MHARRHDGALETRPRADDDIIPQDGIFNHSASADCDVACDGHPLRPAHFGGQLSEGVEPRFPALAAVERAPCEAPWAPIA